MSLFFLVYVFFVSKPKKIDWIIFPFVYFDDLSILLHLILYFELIIFFSDRSFFLKVVLYNLITSSAKFFWSKYSFLFFESIFFIVFLYYYTVLSGMLWFLCRFCFWGVFLWGGGGVGVGVFFFFFILVLFLVFL